MITIDGFEIDAALSEEHNREADVTEFPVEGQSVTSDHVRIKEKLYRLQGIISDTPIGKIAGLRDPNRVPTEVGRTVLEDIFDAKDQVTVVTSLKTYRHMIMQSLQFTVDGTSGAALRFTALFRQIQVTTNKRVAVHSLVTQEDRGNLAAKPADWIATDAKGRDIFVLKGTASFNKPGTEDRYVRADGSQVTPQEAADATRRQGQVLGKFDGKTGKPVPVDQKDYQPYVPRQKKPPWAPTSPTRK